MQKNQYTFKLKIAISLGLKLNTFVYVDFVLILIKSRYLDFSPNLNLIERYWKFVKGKLRTKTYATFTLFCEVINLIMTCKDSKDKKALGSLISAKVQLFDGIAAHKRVK
jgi:hypothetical protein